MWWYIHFYGTHIYIYIYKQVQLTTKTNIIIHFHNFNARVLIDTHWKFSPRYYDIRLITNVRYSRETVIVNERTIAVIILHPQQQRT